MGTPLVKVSNGQLSDASQLNQLVTQLGGFGSATAWTFANPLPAPDATQNDLFTVILTGNTALPAPVNAAVGQQFEIAFTMGGSGGYTVTPNAVYAGFSGVSGGVGSVTTVRFRVTQISPSVVVQAIASNPPTQLAASVALPTAGTLFTGGALLGQLLDKGGFVYNAKHPTYGAVGGGAVVTDGVITSGAATLTSATANFLASDVGLPISVKGAGAAGINLVAFIVSRQSATQVTLSVNAGTSVNPATITWRGPGRLAGDGVMTSGSAVLTSASTVFTAADVGKTITVQQAASGPTALNTTIASYQSATQVTLAANCTNSVNPAVFWYGASDDASSINAAITAASAANGGLIFVPADRYMLMSAPLLPLSNTWMMGAGRDASYLQARAGGQSGGNQDGLRISQAGGSFYKKVSITDFTIDGQMQDAAAGRGVTMEGVDYLRLERLYVLKPGGFGLELGSQGGTGTKIESPILRDIVVDSQQSGVASDSIGGGGINRMTLESYTCINPAGTGMDFTNFNDSVIDNFKIITTSGTPGTRVDGFATDFGANGILWCNFLMNGVYRGSLVNSAAGNAATGVHIHTGKVQASQQDGIAILGIAGTKASHCSVIDVEVTNWNVGNVGANGMNFQEVSDLEVTGAKFYAPANAPGWDIVLDKQGAGVGCDTVRVHDCTFHSGNGVHQATVVQPIWIHDNIYAGSGPQGAAALTVTTGAFSYTNNDGQWEVLYIAGGTVTTVVKNSVTIFSHGGSAANDTVVLAPGEIVTVNNTVVPTIIKDLKERLP